MKWKVTKGPQEADGLPWPTVRHDCRRVGDIEATEDWNFCAYCGNEVPPTIKKQIAAIMNERAAAYEKKRTPEPEPAAEPEKNHTAAAPEPTFLNPKAEEIEQRRTAIAEMDAHITPPAETAPDGYEIETEGQGCYAYRKNLPGGRFVLLTDEEGADLPEEGKPTLVGFYPPDYDDDPRTERACFRTLPTLKAALAFVRRSEDTYSGRG